MSRCYKNPFKERTACLNPSAEFRTILIKSIDELVVHILQALNRKIDQTDLSMYTGVSGILLLSIKIQGVPSLLSETNPSKFVKLCNTLSVNIVNNRDRSKLHRNVSAFTSGYVGPCLVGALLHASFSNGDSSLANCFDRVLRCRAYTSNEMPNEALYGRVGYLSSLLLLKKTGYSVPTTTLAEVVNQVLDDGLKLSSDMQRTGKYNDLVRGSPSCPPCPPLMFQWHEKVYLGAAHGLAGILFVLLKIKDTLPEAISPESMDTLILPTVTWLGQLQFKESGNWPSSLGESMNSDRLVQWCHGAAGIIPTLLAAHKVTHDADLLKRAKHGAEAVWERGLLKKGCGICHGSAGSGYALLSMYNHTQEPMYLQRASAVAKWCTDYFSNMDRTPDRPFSLFEGIAGTIMFLVDMLNPQEAEFPLLA